MTLSIHRGGHPYWTVFLVSLSTRGKNSLQLQHHCIGRLIAVSIVPRRFFIHIRGLLLSSRPCLFSWNCGITDDDGQRHACRRERERPKCNCYWGFYQRLRSAAAAAATERVQLIAPKYEYSVGRTDGEEARTLWAPPNKGTMSWRRGGRHL